EGFFAPLRMTIRMTFLAALHLHLFRQSKRGEGFVPRLSVRPLKMLGGFRVPDDFLLLRVPPEFPPQPHRKISQVARRGYPLAVFHFVNGCASRLDSVQ